MLTPEQLGRAGPSVKSWSPDLVVCFLVTGPTGSGKSTTLASLINFINENYDHHIITIEDPIEFYHYSKKSTVNQREVGSDVTSFSEALRRALRQDPDVILVGELRDLETIEAAISAAETGHVVFRHAAHTSAQGTVNRIIDAFPTNQQEQIRTQLSTTIIGVVSQALLKKIGGGRVAAYEILVVTPAIGNLIRENKTFRINSAIQTGTKKGMQLLDDHPFRLWKEKKVAEEDVMAKAQQPGRSADADRSDAKRGIYEDEEEPGGLSGGGTEVMALKRIGQILVDLGLIDEDQLETMLAEQEARGGDLLGRVGLSLGFYSDEQLGEALAEQWNTTFVTLYDKKITDTLRLSVRQWPKCIAWCR
jgi:twitching motility protein PilT